MSSGGTGPLGGSAETVDAPDQDALHNLCLADPVWRERYDGWTELGRGATAIVVRTHSRALGEDVALKIFPAPFSQDGKRFQDEVRNAQRLASPYIVRIYSPFPRRSLAWIEMELVEGRTLREELEERRRAGRAFTLGETLLIGQAIGEALAAAHQAGVVHRDVKPANLLLPRDGSPVAKLGDFGVSRLAGGAALTRTGLLVGTPQFVAPEVIEGQPSGPASDVYSFGHCVYLMLSGGRPPFPLDDGASPLHWIRAHTSQAPIPVRTHNPDVPPPLADLVSAMLAKDPARRPSAREATASLSALAAGNTPPRSPVGRRRALVSTVAGGLALVVIGLLQWAGPWSPRPEEPTPIASTAPRVADAVPSVPNTVPSAMAPPATTVLAEPPPAMASETPRATAPPSDPPALPVSASLRGDLVGVRNTGADPLPSLELTLVFVAPPARATARHPEGLAPGEELLLALEGFEPAPPTGQRPDSLEIVATGPDGSRRQRVRLH